MSYARAGLAPTRIGGRLFEWGSRTFVMGIVNVTPDSFSGDGLLATAASRGASVEIAETALAQAERMVDEGADLLDVGGESTRPGHEPVPEDEEMARVIPVVTSIHAALPEVPISVDTAKPAVAAAAIDAGAALLNDVWGVSPDDAMARLAAMRRVPLILMHNRATAVYRDLVAEVVSDLRAALDRAMAAGVPARTSSSIRASDSGRRPSTISSSCGSCRRSTCWASPSFSARPASPPSAWSSAACRPRSAWKRPSPRPRSGLPPGSTSCGCTTFGLTSGSPG